MEFGLNVTTCIWHSRLNSWTRLFWSRLCAGVVSSELCSVPDHIINLNSHSNPSIRTSYFGGGRVSRATKVGGHGRSPAVASQAENVLWSVLHDTTRRVRGSPDCKRRETKIPVWTELTELICNNLSRSALFLTVLSQLTAFTESIDCFACTAFSSFFSLHDTTVKHQLRAEIIESPCSLWHGHYNFKKTTEKWRARKVC